MSAVQPNFQTIDCELSQKFRRKEIISKIQSKSCSQIDLEISSLQLYPKLEEHIQEILSAQPSKIVQLSIILSGIEIGSNIISKINANLINMKNLQYFNLEVSNCDISEQDLESLLYELVDLPLLQNLSLDISSNSKVSSNAGQIFGINISQLISLKKLDLNVSNCKNIDDDCINRFSTLIRRMISLESISLHLQQTGIRNYNFLEKLSEIRLLNKLQLSFALVAEEDQQSFESISALSSKIRSLSLNLQGSHFTQDSELGKSFVSNLGNTLDCFSQLKKLYLNLERSHLSSNYITILLKHLAGKLQEGVVLHLNTKEFENSTQIMEAIRRMRSETLSSLALCKILLPKYISLLSQD